MTTETSFTNWWSVHRAAEIAPPPTNSRRSILAAMVMCAAAPMTLAQPASVPATMKLIVPFAPGGTSDAVARAIAKELSQRLGNIIIIENRPGGGGLIGATMVAKGPKDGSVILWHSTSLITSSIVSKKPPFNVLTDLQPLAFVSEGPMLVGVSSASGIKTPQELVAAARAKPNALTYGTPGIGSMGHLGIELLVDAAKVQMRHVPYGGAAPALLDVAAGRVDLTMGSYSSLASQLATGRVVAIGVTSAQPSPVYPTLPPMASAAPGYNTSIWYALFAPSGLPNGLVQRLNHEINEAASAPEVLALTKPDGGTRVEGTSETLAQRMRQEHATWQRLTAEKHIVVE
jgi:tripartite-type tricarboxylate transporter receptor subunit TctC